MRRHRRRRHLAGLGTRRHAGAGPGPVLRARRLRHGHAHEAHRRRRGQPARLHAALRLDGRTPVVVGAVPLARDRAGRRGAAAHGGGRGHRLLRVPAAGARRVLRDPQPGARRGLRDPADRPAGHHRRHQRPDQLPGILRLLALRPDQPPHGLLHHRRHPAGPDAADPAALPQPLRRTAGRRPGLRGAGPLPRLRPGAGQARRLHRLGRDGGAGGGAVRAGRRHHLAGAGRDRAVHPVRHRRGHRRPGQRGRCRPRRDRGGLGADRTVRGIPRRLDVLPGRPVRGGGRLPARRPGLRVATRHAAAPAARRRRPGHRGAEVAVATA